MRFAASAFLFALSAFAATPALASQADEARAESRFHDAERLVDAGKFDEAATALFESERLDPQLGTLINLALCHEALGKTATALREFEAAATWAAERHQPDREQFARQHASDLSRRVTVIRISMAPNVDGLAIALDDEPIAPSSWAVPIILDPGSHRLRATAPGMRPQEVHVDVTQGASDRVVVLPPLEPAPSAPSAHTLAVRAPSPAVFGPDSRGTLGLTVGGIGVVALGLAGYLVAHDHGATPESIAVVAAGGIAVGGGAWLYFGAAPSASNSSAGSGASVGVRGTF